MNPDDDHDGRPIAPGDRLQTEAERAAYWAQVNHARRLPRLATEPSAVYLDRAGRAWWYEDTRTGPLDRLRTAGLTRVPVPVERVEPRHIAEVERAHREGRAPDWGVVA